MRPRSGLLATAAAMVLSSACESYPEPPALTGAVAVTAGGSHACALIADGSVRCWGDGTYGQLGDARGAVARSSGAVRVTGLARATAVAAGGSHTCAVLQDGTAVCWGRNSSGELGVGSDAPAVEAPRPVVGLSMAVGIQATGPTRAASAEYSCAVTRLGSVECWGDDQFAMFVLLSPAGAVTRPLSRADLDGPSSLALGGDHACALLRDGTVRCWGANLVGSLGDGTAEASATPVAVKGLSAVKAVTAGSAHGCALREDGSVHCWGRNASGQLGVGDLADRPEPTPVVGLGGAAVAISAGEDHTCALLANDTIRCWGSNTFGQLGTDASNPTTTPVTVPNPKRARAIASGSAFNCALEIRGTIRCWGDDAAGQLGGAAGSRTRAGTQVIVIAGS